MRTQSGASRGFGYKRSNGFKAAARREKVRAAVRQKSRIFTIPRARLNTRRVLLVHTGNDVAKIAGSTPGAVKYADANARAVDTVTTAGFTGARNVSLINVPLNTVTLSDTGLTNAVAVTDTNTIAFTTVVLGGNFTVNAPAIVAHNTTKLDAAASGTGTLNRTGGLISVSDISSTLSIGTTGSLQTDRRCR